jgi:YD repeat-containing protein
MASQSDYYYNGFGNLIKHELPTAWLVKPGAAVTEKIRPVVEYDYDQMGNKTEEIDANGNKIKYDYDLLGRLIKVTTKVKDVLTGAQVTVVTKHYYDAAGNKIKTIDPNGKVWSYSYSAQGYLLTETDPERNTTRYGYDQLGNKISVTDPRGNGTDRQFTTWYLYDDLNRLSRIVYPDETPPSPGELVNGNYDNPYTEIGYDRVGNKTKERDVNNLVTTYTYTPRNWLATVSQNNELKESYYYNKKGDLIQVKDAVGNMECYGLIGHGETELTHLFSMYRQIK